MLESSLIEDEDVGESGTEEVEHNTEEPKDCQVGGEVGSTAGVQAYQTIRNSSMNCRSVRSLGHALCQAYSDGGNEK